MRHVLGAHAAKDETAAPVALLIVAALSRRITRFAALVARFHAGTLLAPRGASEHAPCSTSPKRGPSRRASDPLPRGRAWLVEMVAPLAVYGNILEHLLKEPETVALLAVSPQAGGLLRPLWRMLRADPMPHILRTAPPMPPSSRRPGSDGDRTPPRAPSGSPGPRRKQLRSQQLGSARHIRA